MPKNQEKKLKIQFDLPSKGDEELDKLVEASGHITRVDAIKQAMDSYLHVLRAANSQPDTSIKVVKANGEVQYSFPSTFLKMIF